jgi:sugar lactone lactonase YvrE
MPATMGFREQMVRKAAGAAAIAALTLLACEQPSLAQTAPSNALPNPYSTVVNFLRLPQGRTWGSTSAVDIDKDGRSVWVAERCGANSCFDQARGQMSPLPPVLKFDRSGMLVKSFGAGMMIFPHGIHVDGDGNIWVTDGQPPLTGAAQAALASQSGPPAGSTRGHQVYKFSPDGTLLMTLGKKGGAAAPDYFYYPNDVLVAPGGDIFVSEGHGGANARILKFRRDGTFITSFGRKGSGRGELNIPHALAMDSRGRLFVGDRGNNRIQIFDQDGNALDAWTQFSRPSGLYIDTQDILYVADSESGTVAPDRKNWTRGIRIGSAKDGTVMYLIPDPDGAATGTSAAEGVAVDATGIIYGAEVGPRAVKRYVRKGN